MTEDDPRRLKEGGEVPPELVRALDALGRDRDAARLARVAEKLGAALGNAPQPQAAATTSGASNIVGLKTVITGLAFGAAVVSFWVWDSEPRPAAPAPARAPAPPSATPAPVANPEPQPSEAPSVPPAQIAAPPSAAPSGNAPADSPRRPVRPRGGPAAPSTAPTGRAAAAAGVRDAPSDAAEPGSTDFAAREPDREVEPQRDVEPERGRDQPPPKEAPRVRSEVELLFEARKAMTTQPTAALGLLDEHAGRYPRGQLAPERDVLRIEALRKLGRSAEADRQLREFQSRYPKSIHLRRLGGSAGSTLAP